MSKFEKGNQIGKETRFQPGNTLCKKYDVKYADSLLEYFMKSEKCPTIEEWAVENKLAIRTVYHWATNENKYPRFASAYAQAKAIQKNKLVQNGLLEIYNASLVKFLLVNNHGMAEKVEQEVKADAKLEVNINVVD